MRKRAISINANLPILGLLGIAFIVLKLTGHISWSWVWVLAPFWAGLGLVFAILLVVLGISILKALKP